MRLLTRRRRRLLGTAVTMLAWAGFVFAWVWLNFNQRDFMQDARVYWRFDFAHLYERGTVGGRDAYLYSPAFAQVMAPFGVMPWEAFRGFWSALNLAVLAWLAGPRIGVVLLLFPGSPVSDEISTGNLHLLIAAAAVIGFRYPQAWAFNLLTKVTPGIGLLWFAVRREWRALVLALGVTVGIGLVSFVVAPHLWFEWADSLRRNSAVAIPASSVAITWPLWLRLVLAAVITIGGALRGWRWTVIVACFLALPVPWFSAPSLLVGVIYLWRHRAAVPDGSNVGPGRAKSVEDDPAALSAGSLSVEDGIGRASVSSRVG